MDDRKQKKRWKEFVQSRSPRVRDELIRDYAVLARRAVERLQITPWGCVNNDDLLGHAVLGLIDAVDRYDPDQGAAFEAFAMPRIRGAVLDALRRLDWVPRSVRADETRLRRAFGRLEGTLGRPPSMAEVAAELGISEAALDDLVSDIARSSLLSLDDLVAGMPESSPLAETLGSDADDPYRDRERSEARERLKGAIAALPEREKEVVSLYYFHEMTLKEIGRILDVTEQRVSQIHARAMLRMSHRLLRHQDLMLALAA